MQRKARDVDGALVGNLADHAVDQDVCASPTHASAGAARKGRGEMRPGAVQANSFGRYAVPGFTTSRPSLYLHPKTAASVIFLCRFNIGFQYTQALIFKNTFSP